MGDGIEIWGVEVVLRNGVGRCFSEVMMGSGVWRWFCGVELRIGVRRLFGRL